MGNVIFDTNLLCIQKRDSSLAKRISDAVSNGYYAHTRPAKTGFLVPHSADGIAFHSMYDPVREGRSLIDSVTRVSFLVFAGIGGAFHVTEFLSRFPEGHCIIAESGYASFRSLIELIDLSAILSDPRVAVFPDCTEDSLVRLLPHLYIPVIQGDFRLLSLRPWQMQNRKQNEILERNIHSALTQVSSDFSVQAHFGRLWMRNCVQNLKAAGNMQGTFPNFDKKKTAVVIAAGPSLEHHLKELRTHRDAYIIFTTDTAFSTLFDSGIQADIFVSIDAQSVSVSHVMHPVPPGMLVILDICGNPGIVRRARECGAAVIFASGGHPLAEYASSFSALPKIHTASGTVTLAALDAAHSLGFTNVALLGADFAYLGGKPYARGTYLASLYGKNAARYSPEELSYCSLIFRTPVTRIEGPRGLTYTTDTLERYARANTIFTPNNRWTPDMFNPFPAEAFLRKYREDLENLLINNTMDNGILYTILPFLSWCTENKIRPESPKNRQDTIQLALDLIAGYTDVS